MYLIPKTFQTRLNVKATKNNIWDCEGDFCCPLCRYATIYTMFPVFSLVLDQDVKPEMALLYPELYKDLTKVLQRLTLASATSRVVHFGGMKTHVLRGCFSLSPPQGRSLSFKTFLIWVLISVYQGKRRRLRGSKSRFVVLPDCRFIISTVPNTQSPQTPPRVPPAGPPFLSILSFQPSSAPTCGLLSVQ